MKRLPYFSHYWLIVIALGVMVLLTSCKQLAQFNILPAAGEIPTPGSIDPGLELSSKYLICPSIPSTSPLIPTGPYDEDVGDCALRGKSAEIEAWLTTLEQIAASCQANRETNWAATLAARDHLDSKIDELEDNVTVITPTVEIDDEESATFKFEGYEILNLSAVEECPEYTSNGLMEPFSGGEGDNSNYYIFWLTRIGEDVGKYCTMIDEIIKPLWQACDEINFYQDCRAADPDQYHTIIESQMIAARANYDYADFFYTHILQTAGWVNFRTYYTEASLDCPPIQAFPSPPIFTFNTNAFCRIGPSLEYEKVATFLQGQDVQIDGKNQSEPHWWWVPIPYSIEHCWVSDSTGSATGILEDLEIVAAPPLNISPAKDQCSINLGESACLAAGGQWVKKDIPGGSYCNCK